MGARHWPRPTLPVRGSGSISAASTSTSVVVVAVLALAFALLLNAPERFGASACSAGCNSADSDDSCLFCSANCGLCEDYGFTTRCNQPGTAHLTIDDGPFDSTGVALDILKWKNVSATFFLLGSTIAAREAIVKRIVREGHNVGSHSWDHAGFNQPTTNIPNQLSQTAAEILRVTNLTITDFRPPFGECNKACMQALQGWNVRLWNLDTLDYAGSMTTLRNQVDNTMDGFDLAISGWVVGMHLRDNLGLCALPVLIDRIRARGYTFVTADECWGAASLQPIPGVMQMPSRVGIPPECNPAGAPRPLNFGACSAEVGCWTPKSCCSTHGFCSTQASDCGLGCKGGWCDSCQGWVVQAPNPPPVPKTAWPSCTVSSPLFINACTSSANGGCHATNTRECVMTGSGTRTCVCHTGWTGTTCATNINECATNNGGCAVGATCTDQSPGRTCTCRSGFTGDGVEACVDINECATANGGCPAESTCTNFAPVTPFWNKLFTCSACAAGYSGTGQVGTTCAQINECAVNNGGCSTVPPVLCKDNAPTALNPVNSTCDPCPTGYSGNGKVCTDTNECAVNNGGCSSDPPVNCYNSVGSFSCLSGVNCTNGFSGANPCSPCPSGYTGDGKTCAETNECATANGGCHHSSVCTNTPGSFTCGPCRTGYTGNGVTCTNVNECATANGDCSGATPICTDRSPSIDNAWVTHTCTACPPGYTGTVGACVDVDECAASGSTICSQDPPVSCHNTPGAYYCAYGSNCPEKTSCPVCPPGYESTDHGATCTDVNECATANGRCYAGATCTNTRGSFRCSACPTGMTGDGVTCANVNECATENGGCDATVACTDLSPNPSNGWLGKVCGDCPGGYTDSGDCALLDCTSSPCHNGGACAAATPANGIAFTCTCAEGFTGRFCEVVAEPDTKSSDSGRLAAITVPTIIGGLIVLGVVALCVRHRLNAKPAQPPAGAAAAGAAAGGAAGPRPAAATAAPTPAHSPAARSGAVNIPVPRSPEVAPVPAASSS